MSDPAHTDAQPNNTGKFARDVGVNVIANLIAAAIIYLLGAAAGLLPRSAPAIAAALLGLAPLIAYPLLWVASIVPNRRLGLSLRLIAATLTAMFVLAIAWGSDIGAGWAIAMSFSAVGIVGGAALRLRGEWHTPSGPPPT